MKYFWILLNEKYYVNTDIFTLTCSYNLALKGDRPWRAVKTLPAENSFYYIFEQINQVGEPWNHSKNVFTLKYIVSEYRLSQTD